MTKRYRFYKKYKNYPNVIKEIYLRRIGLNVDTVDARNHNLFSSLPYEKHYIVDFDFKTHKEKKALVGDKIKYHV